MFETLRVSNINSNYYDNIDERYTTSNDLTSAGASARLARLDVGRAVLRGDAIEVAGAFSPRRLPALRALPGAPVRR